MMDLAELEYRLIYAVIVAGKSARFAETVATRLLHGAAKPFDLVREWKRDGTIESHVRAARTGKYRNMIAFLNQVVDAHLDLTTVEADALERLPGVGPKTSRFFIIWTRPEARYAALDVHILRWLRAQGYDVPPSTPQRPSVYRAIEQLFLSEADKRGLRPRDLDAQIWSAATGIH